MPQKQPTSGHASLRIGRGYSSHVSARRYSCRPWLSSFLLRPSQEVASVKRKHRPKARNFMQRPPVPPRTWNKSATLYAGHVEGVDDRASIRPQSVDGDVLELDQSSAHGPGNPRGVEIGSPPLIRHGNQWWLHTPIEKQFKSPSKIEKQVTTNRTNENLCRRSQSRRVISRCVRSKQLKVRSSPPRLSVVVKTINGLRKKQLRTHCTQPKHRRALSPKTNKIMQPLAQDPACR